jgi:hypothetical protein
MYETDVLGRWLGMPLDLFSFLFPSSKGYTHRYTGRAAHALCVNGF